ncbi:MAG TPA: Stp1/IreP family PP2C-type Ser/Thr phosphatase [Burkholderiaceae bacterium]|nr:Stp1/IreP family PP2C-type Ser/Thr phosphatase [Burkholderiaceae bacterium]
MSYTPEVDLELVTASDPGVVRSHNEDSIVVSERLGLAILADGMGGYNAGEVASGLATSLIERDLDADLDTLNEIKGVDGAHIHQLLQARIGRANLAIFEAAQADVQLAGMGTTLVLGLFHGQRVTIAHIGDSRAYRWRDGFFEQLTRDHSLLQEQIEAGLLTADQARRSLNKNLVTRAVGVDPAVIADIHDYDTRIGDIFLFCSDGLTDMVTDDAIAEILAASTRLDDAAQALVRLANECGGRDNISVILAGVRSGAARPSGLVSRMRNWLGQ